MTWMEAVRMICLILTYIFSWQIMYSIHIVDSYLDLSIVVYAGGPLGVFLY